MNIDETRLDEITRSLGPLSARPEDDFDMDDLLAYHDKALDGAELERVEARLAIDPRARAFLADLATPPSPFMARWVRRRLLRRRRRRQIGALAAIAAAAAALLFALTPSAHPPPAYAVSYLRGVTVESRDEMPDLRAEAWPLDGEARLVLTLAPEDPDGEVDARGAAYVDRPDGELTLSAVQPGIGKGGAIVIDASAAALFGERSGRRTLHVALTRGSEIELPTRRPAPDGPIEGAVRWMVLRFDYTAPGE